MAATEGLAAQSTSTIDLFWIPLGAGGSGLVRASGRLYESITARRESRPPMALLHTALLLYLPEGRFVVETMWPSPDTHLAARGVVLQGDVGGRLVGLLPWFRYEIRCWRDGVLPDAAEAIGGPQTISDDIVPARRLLQEARRAPALVWGRDQMAAGEMWNSNSVISWLLTRVGLPIDDIRPPAGTRAPGWDAGIVIAHAEDGFSLPLPPSTHPVSSGAGGRLTR
jgi:hypothetical protein